MTARVSVLIVLVLMAGAVRWQTRVVDVAVAAPLDDLPMELGSWRGRRAVDYAPEVVAVLGVDDYVNRAYSSASGQPANVYVGYYRSQQQGGAIHSPLNCLPGGGWEPEHVERVPFSRGAARRVIIRKGSQRLLVLYWYQTPTRIEGDEYRGRFYTVLDAMRHGRNDAAMVRVIVPIDAASDGEARATGDALELAALVRPHVDRVLFPDGPTQTAARVR